MARKPRVTGGVRKDGTAKSKVSGERTAAKQSAVVQAAKATRKATIRVGGDKTAANLAYKQAKKQAIKDTRASIRAGTWTSR